MRTLIGISILFMGLAACQSTPDKASAGKSPFQLQENPYVEKLDSTTFTKIGWQDMDQDLGTVKEGEQVPVVFHFTNTGDKPLVIYSVQPSCGCTVAESPKEPIAPGKEGIIKGSFNSKGRVGLNNKTLYVRANTFGGTDHSLHFKVAVNKP